MKINYGRQGDAIQIRWHQGVFVLENNAENDLNPCKHPANIVCVCVSPIPHRRRGGCSTLTANHSYPRMKSRHLMGLRSSNDLPVHGL
jgi:hypothetical protein